MKSSAVPATLFCTALMLAPLCGGAGSAKATTAIAQQTGIVKGTVVDANGEAVIGASVIIEGQKVTQGTVTDFDGNFSLNVKPGAKLKISYIGFVSQTVLLNIFFPELDALSSLTFSVILGVVVTLLGIAIIGVAGSMKAASLSEEEKKAAVKDFNFPKGLAITLLAGFMSGCFNVGLAFGDDIHFGIFTPDMFKTLPATFLVTVGGFITNAIYCFYQNTKNHTWSDYKNEEVWGNNILYCALAGALWYSQFFGLSLGKGFLTESPTLMTLSFCILMALNVVFSNVWGIILKEWKGCS